MSDDNRFHSSFHVDARLKCTIQQLRKRLDQVPSLKLIGYGTVLKYKIDGDGERQYLELSNDAIRLVFYFAKLSDAVFSTCLMRLMAILAVIDDLYEIRLGAVYNYIIDVLGKTSMQFRIGSTENALVSRLSNELEGLAFANSKLSHDIYDNAIRERDLREKLTLCKMFCSKVLGASSWRGFDVNEELEKLFGIGVSLAEKIESITKEGD